MYFWLIPVPLSFGILPAPVLRSEGGSEIDAAIRKGGARRSALPVPASTPVPPRLSAPDSLRLFLRGTGDDHHSSPTI